MPTLDPERLSTLSLPLATSWLLADCMEARGKQDLWLRQRPEALETLRELAIIRSVESSNRIEGVTVSTARLRPLVLGRSRPRDRSEEEIAGYRRALEWVFTRKRLVDLTPRVILHLHGLAQQGTADAGRLKPRDNEIIELLPGGGRRVRFVPVSAAKTPAMLARLCAGYRRATAHETLPSLLVIAAAVLDLLCVDPFRDGNGRVSRLLTTLLLQQNGFQVGRYISLERLVEDRKEDYYAALQRCSDRWHEDRGELTPWLNFVLGVVRSAYAQLEERVMRSAARPSKSDLVRQLVLSQPDAFTLADLSVALPNVSAPLVRRVLGALKRAGKVRLAGRGRGATWRVAR